MRDFDTELMHIKSQSLSFSLQKSLSCNIFLYLLFYLHVLET